LIFVWDLPLLVCFVTSGAVLTGGRMHACKCDCHVREATLCRDCYIWHVTLRQFKNAIEPLLTKEGLLLRTQS
jgi:hypothetical protein